MSRALRPLFVTVTWGAGGSTSFKSLELAEICQRQLGLTTCLHLTCTNMNKDIVDEALAECKALGIRNILALRGDPPRSEEYRIEGDEGTADMGIPEADDADQFVWAADLVRYIRRRHGDYFCIGVAAYPEGHADQSHPTDQTPVHDMPFLVEKIRAGADFIMTQLFYDVNAYQRFDTLIRTYDNGVLKDVPMIPGLMPIQSYQVLKRTTKLSHAKLPDAILQRLEGVKGDDEEVKRVGVDIMSDMIETIKQMPTRTPQGFHFYTLNLEKAVSFVLERCHLIPPDTPESNGDDTSAIDDSSLAPPVTNGTDKTHLSLTNGSTPKIKPHNRRPSSPHNRVMNDSSSTTLSEPSHATDLAITHGIGSLGREATWDDYPNGRFGDARSPAFGEIDGYGGPTLHVSPQAARSLWGSLNSPSDIAQIFLKHVNGTVDSLPWSEGPINSETLTIREPLRDLIAKRNWWTIASQPAVDGLPSSHETFGWGPRGGFVFQKSFVEFFMSATDWKSILRPHLTSPDIAPEVSWYMCTSRGDFESSEANQSGTRHDAAALTSSSSSSGAVNAVTWGSFPGKEIVTPTIIEEISFRAWAEEAFGIWTEWERCWGAGTETRRVLRDTRDGLVLVNVIGHGYREEERLWEILMSA